MSGSRWSLGDIADVEAFAAAMVRGAVPGASGAEVEDLVQEAALDLLLLWRKFDSDRSPSFAGWASRMLPHRIWAAVGRLRADERIDPLPLDLGSPGAMVAVATMHLGPCSDVGTVGPCVGAPASDPPLQSHPPVASALGGMPDGAVWGPLVDEADAAGVEARLFDEVDRLLEERDPRLSGLERFRRSVRITVAVSRLQHCTGSQVAAGLGMSRSGVYNARDTLRAAVSRLVDVDDRDAA